MRICHRRSIAALALVSTAIAATGCTREPPSGVAVVHRSDSDRGEISSLSIVMTLVPLDQPPGHRFDVHVSDQEALARFAALDHTAQASILSVHVIGDVENPPAMLGTTAVDGDRLTFTPRFPLEPGTRYRLSLDVGSLLGNSSEPMEAEYSVPKETAEPSTVVETIYPTADVLPENQLKFYLHFSAPMSRGEAYGHVHLLDAEGREVEAPFLELGQELWDGDFRRFTLLCDPGRVKRGLKPREELGPVLREGGTYTLVVDADWRDATRTPLAAAARKTFSVAPPDDAPIDPERWKIQPPKAGGNDPLVVHFGEPLDAALAERVIWVATESGEKLSGSIRTTDHESCWQFTPEQPWRTGAYQLVAETTLEDLAGTAIGRAFEVDEVKPIEKRIETQTDSIPFTVAP
jgi:hypothetical protein